MATISPLNRRWALTAAALLILFVAFRLRVHLLGAQSLWNDEGNSYVQATRSVPDILDNAARDIHPPGYYLLLGGWRLLAGETEFALRALSAFASLLTVAFTYAIGNRLYGAWAGIASALLIALHSFSVYYAQEARMYALLGLCSAAGMWATIRLVHAAQGGKQLGGWAVALGLINAAGLYTQYFYPFMMVAQGVIALIAVAQIGSSNRRLLAAYVGANVLALVLFAPWLPTALTQVTTWSQAGEMTLPFAAQLASILTLLLFGVVTPIGVLALPEILLLFGLLGAKGRNPTWHERWALLLPVIWVVVPVLLFFVFRLYRESNLKLLIGVQVGIALWLARGLWVLWTLRLGGRRQIEYPRLIRLIPKMAALLAFVWLANALFTGTRTLYADPTYQRADYRGIAATIGDEAQPGDIILLNAPNQQEVFNYYAQRFALEAMLTYPLPPGLGGNDEETRTLTEGMIAAHPGRRVFAIFWGERERDPNLVVEQTLETTAFGVDDRWFGDVRLARYVLPEPLPITYTSDALFGDNIRLISYALNQEQLVVGDSLLLQLRWQTDADVSERYKVFVQLLNERGELVTQRDSEPQGGIAPTNSWSPSQLIIDQHALLLPTTLLTGEYTLILGLYDIEAPNTRLPLTSRAANEEQRYLTLATITVR